MYEVFSIIETLSQMHLEKQASVFCYFALCFSVSQSLIYVNIS